MRSSIFLFLFIIVVGCGGKAPSSLLRVGQAPVYDFPLYVSSQDGNIYKYNELGSRTIFASGLSSPQGITTDKYGNLYVVEQGNSRLLKYKISDGSMTVLASGLSTPGAVAVNSVGEVFVAQEGNNTVVRASDLKVFGTYASRPTAISFGVNDLPLLGLYDSNYVYWGFNSATASGISIQEPVQISTDASGRVFVAEGAAANARVFRFNQRDPGGQTVVADALQGPNGIAVDAVGNIYIAETGANRIVLASFNGTLYNWNSISLPLFLAFTQY